MQFDEKQIYLAYISKAEMYQNKILIKYIQYGIFTLVQIA